MDSGLRRNDGDGCKLRLDSGLRRNDGIELHDLDLQGIPT
jgi:hypothetical protein